jgi:hypothetical protein
VQGKIVRLHGGSGTIIADEYAEVDGDNCIIISPRVLVVGNNNVVIADV